MSDKFSLLSGYTELGKAENETALLKVEAEAHKVKYQEYLIEVESKEQSVYIPIRECDNFEKILEHTTDINTQQLRKLLREFRGIRNIG